MEREWVKVELLSRGGFGVVTKWIHCDTGQCVAVKRFMVRQDTSRNGDEAKVDEHAGKCSEEVERMIKLQHPNVVTAMAPPPALVAALGMDRALPGDSPGDPHILQRLLPKPVLCMEFCNGGDLRGILGKPENLSGLPEDQVRALLRDLSSGLLYLHQSNVIHRDIKPENILLHIRSNNEVLYKLGDLGLSKDVPRIDKSFSTEVGTFLYRAPEMSLSRRTNYKVDYWSLGVTVVEILYGTWHLKEFGFDEGSRAPYQHHLSPKFHGTMKTWLSSMLHVDVDRRGIVWEELRATLLSQNQPNEPPVGGAKSKNPVSRIHFENPLCWMNKFLERGQLRLKPDVRIPLEQECHANPGQLQRQSCPPWVLAKADVFVVTSSHRPFVLSPDEMLPRLHTHSEQTLLAYSRDLPKEYKLRFPGSVWDLIGGSPEVFRGGEGQQQLWVDALFYLQTELRVARGYMEAWECLEKLDQTLYSLRLVVYLGSGVRRKLTLPNPEDPEVAPEEPEVVRERNKWLGNLERRWTTAKNLYAAAPRQHVGFQRLSALRELLALFAQDQKKLIESILTRFRYLTPKKIPREIHCNEDELKSKNTRQSQDGKEPRIGLMTCATISAAVSITGTLLDDLDPARIRLPPESSAQAPLGLGYLHQDA